MQTPLVVLLAAMGCGGLPKQQPQLVRKPVGVSGHLAEADKHQQQAVKEAQLAEAAEVAESQDEAVSCADPVLNDNLTSGDETVTFTWVPCENVQLRSKVRHHAKAAREFAAARENYEAADRLIAAERASCAGIPEDDVAYLPFARPDTIRSVREVRSDGQPGGVRIELTAADGRDAAWMSRVIACEQARFEALGRPPTYHADDPTLVAGADVTVIQRGPHVEVAIDAETPEAALIVTARARELITPGAPPEDAGPVPGPR